MAKKNETLFKSSTPQESIENSKKRISISPIEEAITKSVESKRRRKYSSDSSIAPKGTSSDSDSIGREFRKLLKSSGINRPRNDKRKKATGKKHRRRKSGSWMTVAEMTEDETDVLREALPLTQDIGYVMDDAIFHPAIELDELLPEEKNNAPFTIVRDEFNTNAEIAEDRFSQAESSQSTMSLHRNDSHGDRIDESSSAETIKLIARDKVCDETENYSEGRTCTIRRVSGSDIANQNNSQRGSFETNISLFRNDDHRENGCKSSLGKEETLMLQNDIEKSQLEASSSDGISSPKKTKRLMRRDVVREKTERYSQRRRTQTILKERVSSVAGQDLAACGEISVANTCVPYGQTIDSSHQTQNQIEVGKFSLKQQDAISTRELRIFTEQLAEAHPEIIEDRHETLEPTSSQRLSSLRKQLLERLIDLLGSVTKVPSPQRSDLQDGSELAGFTSASSDSVSEPDVEPLGSLKSSQLHTCKDYLRRLELEAPNIEKYTITRYGPTARKTHFIEPFKNYHISRPRSLSNGRRTEIKDPGSSRGRLMTRLASFFGEELPKSGGRIEEFEIISTRKRKTRNMEGLTETLPADSHGNEDSGGSSAITKEKKKRPRMIVDTSDES
uniref:Uncharacterized protein n=1 Tax=Bracon brevicornis TaxID=1563983 RepID=A0A6V7JTF4_9HYME